MNSQAILCVGVGGQFGPAPGWNNNGQPSPLARYLTELKGVPQGASLSSQLFKIC